MSDERSSDLDEIDDGFGPELSAYEKTEATRLEAVYRAATPAFCCSWPLSQHALLAVAEAGRAAKPCACGALRETHALGSPGCEHHDHHCESCHETGRCTTLVCRDAEVRRLREALEFYAKDGKKPMP